MLRRALHALSLVLVFVLLTRGSPEGQAQPSASYPSQGEVAAGDAAFNALVPAGTPIEQLAEGFEWAEGPVWRVSGSYLLFSDVPANTIYQWSEAEGLHVFLRPSGYDGMEPPGAELGTNGLAFDGEGRLLMADHGNRRIARLDETLYTKEPLAERYDGHRFNSPNDLAVHSSGAVYFTDPPYGLRGQDDDPAKEIPFNGVYRLAPDGTVTLLTDELTRPNGVILSPDEQTLYVANSDPAHAVWMAYDVQADGSIGNGRVFYDATSLVGETHPGLPDGMAMGQAGHLFATGPGGVLVFSPEGELLGTITANQATANCTFGDDGTSLYLTSDGYLLRVQTATRGVGF